MKANDVTIETAPGVDDWRKHLLSDCVRNGPLSGLIAACFSDTRSYLRRLRAAEMAAWEFSGGDYLLSKCANHVHARLQPNGEPAQSISKTLPKPAESFFDTICRNSAVSQGDTGSFHGPHCEQG